MEDPTLERERALLAPYAMHSADSAGRRYTEAPHPYRGPYQRDRDRILHSSAFRRLSYKTQVFTGEMGDYHRTRLTHTLEVSSIARTIARTLRLNEDLVEALALAHDLGHPPFGHSGEDVLDECLRDCGGFSHNAQALRICELIESRYADFPGLNLTREVLEGQEQRANKGQGARSHPEATRPGVNPNSSGDYTPLPAPRSPLLEVQVVDVADSIAYDAHDADDALEIGLLTLNELLEVPLWQDARDRVVKRVARDLDERQLRRAIVHELIESQVSDVVQYARAELSAHQVHCVADVRNAPMLIFTSDGLCEKKLVLERFLFDKVYRHPQLLAKRQLAQQALRDTFEALVKAPEKLPPKFRRLAERDGVHRAAGDYLAGMTDRFAFDEHRRLVGS